MEQGFPQLIDPARLARALERHAAGYAGADPFPHCAIDDPFDPAVLDLVLSEFPTPEEIRWRRFDNAREIKYAASDLSEMKPATRAMFHALNGPEFVGFLERLSGIQGLIPDPRLEGGGLHMIPRGGKLGIHADFNRHSVTKLDRRLNVLIYLNRDWREEYGGHLELWDQGMTACRRRVLPGFNRMVVFSTTSQSYHGHPDPLTCPEGWFRRSLALYYYSNGRPEAERGGGHDTLFRDRPDEKTADRGLLKKLMPWLKRRG